MSIQTSDFIILFFFLALSGFSSGAESALFSLKKSEIHRFSISSSRRERAIYEIMKKPEGILITILLINLFVNLIASAILTKLLLGIFSTYGHLISIALLTPIIIILCDIFPKIIAINNSVTISKNVVLVLGFLHRALLPVRYLLMLFTERFIRLFRLRIEQERGITREELDVALSMGLDEGIINKEESGFIKNVLRFSNKEAINVMIPRTRALFIPHDCSINRAVRIFKESGAVRAPVYKNNIDTIIGVLDSRELLPYVRGYKKASGITDFIHSITHYPSTKQLDELLTDFLRKKIEIAIVVDEYGGTEGVVTLSSIISELFGQEHILEKAPKPQVRKIDDLTFLVPGDMQIDDFNDFFNEDIETKESETIGGYLIERTGGFPEKQSEFRLKHNLLRVKSIRRNRIESIEIIRNG